MKMKRKIKGEKAYQKRRLKFADQGQKHVLRYHG